MRSANLFLILTAILAGLSPTLSHAQDIPLPNIVFMMADDLGYGDLGCYNPDSKIPTPHLDGLAAQGMRFTDAHAPSSVCTPTRYAVLTGRYAWRTHLKSGVLNDTSPPLIEQGRLTVPKLLRLYGYQTAAIGKWHLGRTWHLLDNNAPASVQNIDWTKPMINGAPQQGFDYYFGICKPGWGFMENVHVPVAPTEAFDLSAIGPRLIGPNNMKGFRVPGFEHEQMLPAYIEKTEAFIERAAADGRPFFLYWTPCAPHKPVVPNEAFQGKSEAGLYGDFVAELDYAVGRVLAALERHGLAENTLVIFSADNGPETEAYDRARDERHYSMGDLRGVKRDVWEGGHRVPFLVRWPGRVQAGAVSEEVVCLVDLLATGAALVGHELPIDAGEDSYDLLPAFLGEALDAPIREATVHHGSNGVLGIRQGDWVYIDAPTGAVSREVEWFRMERRVVEHQQAGELFNLRDDPQQTRNRYDEHPETVKRLRGLLVKYLSSDRSTP